VGRQRRGRDVRDGGLLAAPGPGRTDVGAVSGVCVFEAAGIHRPADEALPPGPFRARVAFGPARCQDGGVQDVVEEHPGMGRGTGTNGGQNAEQSVPRVATSGPAHSGGRVARIGLWYVGMSTELTQRPYLPILESPFNLHPDHDLTPTHTCPFSTCGSRRRRGQRPNGTGAVTRDWHGSDQITPWRR
jgi:hypothetical protein